MTFLSSSSMGTGMGVATTTGAKVQPHITTIEWEMLDKRRFYPLSMMSSFTVRCFLYPLTLIRTRLQVLFMSLCTSSTMLYFRSSTRTRCIRGLLMLIDRFLRLRVTEGCTEGFGFQLFRSELDLGFKLFNVCHLLAGGVGRGVRLHLRGG